MWPCLETNTVLDAGKSTCDALMRFKDIVEAAFQGDGVVLAVSLDIKNAFNSIPWPTIREALIRKDFPDYLRRIIDSYLFQRCVEYSTSDGIVVRPRGCPKALSWAPCFGTLDMTVFFVVESNMVAR